MQPTHRAILVGARLIWHRYADLIRTAAKQHA
jgi:hypothetical protein